MKTIPTSPDHFFGARLIRENDTDLTISAGLYPSTSGRTPKGAGASISYQNSRIDYGVAFDYLQFTLIEILRRYADRFNYLSEQKRQMGDQQGKLDAPSEHREFGENARTVDNALAAIRVDAQTLFNRFMDIAESVGIQINKIPSEIASSLNLDNNGSTGRPIPSMSPADLATDESISPSSLISLLKKAVKSPVNRNIVARRQGDYFGAHGHVTVFNLNHQVEKLIENNKNPDITTESLVHDLARLNDVPLVRVPKLSEAISALVSDAKLKSPRLLPLIIDHQPNTLSSDRLPIPTKPPASWQDDGPRPGESPPAFIMRVYEPWHGKGLTRADIRRLDPPLYVKLTNWLRTYPPPPEFNLPTVKQRNDLWIDKIKAPQAQEPGLESPLDPRSAQKAYWASRRRQRSAQR
tara:strand:- start:795 stop:2021 length:1227 start_codon:yes stop_codon:yes gene_type:complete